MGRVFEVEAGSTPLASSQASTITGHSKPVLYTPLQPYPVAYAQDTTRAQLYHCYTMKGMAYKNSEDK